MAIVIFVLIGLIAPIACNNYSDCGSEKAELMDVRVSKCENQTRCPLVRGDMTYLEIDLKPTVDIDSVTASVSGKIFGATLPFIGVKRKGCENSGLPCPLEAGKSYTYNNTIDVKSYFPELDVDVIWKLMDKKKVIVCALIPAVLV